MVSAIHLQLLITLHDAIATDKDSAMEINVQDKVTTIMMIRIMNGDENK